MSRGRKPVEDEDRRKTFGMSLTDEEVNKLTQFGKGNRSAGVRRMMAIIEKLFSEDRLSDEDLKVDG